MEVRSTNALFIIKVLSLALVTIAGPAETRKDTAAPSGGTSSGDTPQDTLLRLFETSFDPEDGVVSGDCRRDSALYREALRNYEPWALQMYDASTKIPSGLITGNYKQLGNYDECLRVRSDGDFVGKACSAQVQFTISDDDNGGAANDLDMGDLLTNVALAAVLGFTVKIKVSSGADTVSAFDETFLAKGMRNWTSGESFRYEWLWCVPSSCGPRDIVETVEVVLDPLKRSTRVDFVVTVGNESCHTEELDRAVLELADWLYISLLVLFGVVVIASTSYDMIKLHSSEKPDSKDVKHTIFSSFSVYTNGKRLLNVRRGADTIACLDGLRFLSICWIIYGHTNYLEIVGAKLDLTEVPTMHENWANFLVLNSNIVTDTFFLLGGILLAYTEMCRKSKDPSGHRLSILKLYVHRYLRLTPAYAMVIGFYATLFYKLGSGPHWNIWVGTNTRFCQDNWWTNLLYVNNYVNIETMCLSQSWYLSVDMQLIWISPIFLYPMLGNGGRKQLVFFVVLTTGFLTSVLVPFLVTYFNSLTGTMLYYKEQADVVNVYLQIYTRVYARAGPFLLGLGLGYFFGKINPSSTKMPLSLVIGGWTISVVAGLAVVFGPRGMYYSDHGHDDVEAAFYAGLHRPVFALAVGWIIVASVFDCAGPVGVFLSWSGWVPLSKLTYSAYLTHYIILLYNAGAIRVPGSLTTFGVVETFFGNLAVTLILSTIVSLVFEMPFVRLDRLLTSGVRRPSFTGTAFKPNASPFSSWDSTQEIYRSIDDVTNVSRTYSDLMDRYAKVSIGSQDQPRSSNVGRNSSEPGTSYLAGLDGPYNPPDKGESSLRVTEATGTRILEVADPLDKHGI